MYSSIETIDDLISALESLLVASKDFRLRCRYKAADQRANDPELQKKRLASFNDQAVNIYSLYMQLQKSGLAHPQAVRRIREDHELGYEDTEVLITQGRRVFKDQRRDNIRRDHAAMGYSITDLANMHGLAYNTIKAIISQNTD